MPFSKESEVAMQCYRVQCDKWSSDNICLRVGESALCASRDIDEYEVAKLDNRLREVGYRVRGDIIINKLVPAIGIRDDEVPADIKDTPYIRGV